MSVSYTLIHPRMKNAGVVQHFFSFEHYFCSMRQQNSLSTTCSSPHSLFSRTSADKQDCKTACLGRGLSRERGRNGEACGAKGQVKKTLLTNFSGIVLTGLQVVKFLNVRIWNIDQKLKIGMMSRDDFQTLFATQSSRAAHFPRAEALPAKSNSLIWER